MSENDRPTQANRTTGMGGVEKIRTIIEGFDDISHGGLPSGRTTLVSGTSGTGKTLLPHCQDLQIQDFFPLFIVQFKQTRSVTQIPTANALLLLQEVVAAETPARPVVSSSSSSAAASFHKGSQQHQQ